MKLNLGERLVESHHVGKRPLVCPQLPHRRCHKNRPKFVHYQDLRNIERISPQHTKLLASSLTVKLGEILSITHNHHIKNAIVSRTYRFGLFLPYFEDFCSLLEIYDSIGTIHVLTEYIHVSVDERQLFYVVAGGEGYRMENFVLVGVYY